MHKLLEYPFDSSVLLKKKRRIRRELKENGNFIKKKVAILGGSTTSEIKDMLELFLLNYGIEPEFYESEFGQFWQDAMFPNEQLEEFSPDIIYIHTSNRNILQYPGVYDAQEQVEATLEEEYNRYQSMWIRLSEKYHCPIIQNNFEMPYYRLLGNKDASDIHGKIHFLSELNIRFYQYAQSRDDFYINDINYLSAVYGLDRWSDPLYWHMYKYCVCIPAIPELAYNVANIVKSIYGKNKKALVLDLDNTLWGGVVGDDGVDKIVIGHETSMGQAYSEFQEYIKAHKDLGIMLNVNSKNDYENAIAGLNHPEGTLRPEDFILIKANWENKDKNIYEISKELNIGEDSLVFIDDNPVERDIVKNSFPTVAAPAIDKVERYIQVLDRAGYFEVTKLSEDDKKRNEMYKKNIQRAEMSKSFDNYDEYLKSLQMEAVIRPFDEIYMPRIAQLTNKSNQFNLTTKRLSETDIRTMSESSDHICLYGKLKDKFGDNGVITVVIGRAEKEILHIKLWLMSCRVLKRGMEQAMLDELVLYAKKRGISQIKGYYYKTAKNAMVANLYREFGFEKISENENGDSEWILNIKDYNIKNKNIKVVRSL